MGKNTKRRKMTVSESYDVLVNEDFCAASGMSAYSYVDPQAEARTRPCCSEALLLLRGNAFEFIRHCMWKDPPPPGKGVQGACTTNRN